MLRTVIGNLMAATVLLPINAALASDPPSSSSAIESAVASCTVAAATGRFETTFPVAIYMNIPRSAGRVQSVKDAPDFIQRYIATSANGVPPQFVYQFKTGTGGVWAILRSWVDRCDVLVTGPEVTSADHDALAAFTDKTGWRAVGRREASQSAPSSHFSFVKLAPQPQFPNYGIAAIINNAGLTANSTDSIRVEIAVMAGDVSTLGGALNVKTIRPAINPILP